MTPDEVGVECTAREAAEGPQRWYHGELACPGGQENPMVTMRKFAPLFQGSGSICANLRAKSGAQAGTQSESEKMVAS